MWWNSANMTQGVFCNRIRYAFIEGALGLLSYRTRVATIEKIHLFWISVVVISLIFDMIRGLSSEQTEASNLGESGLDWNKLWDMYRILESLRIQLARDGCLFSPWKNVSRGKSIVMSLQHQTNFILNLITNSEDEIFMRLVWNVG